jgi:hypothetical protein
MSTGVVTDTSKEPRAVAERMVDAMSRGDSEAVASLFTEDVVWEVMGADYMGSGPRYEGKKAAVEDFLFGTAAPLFDFDAPSKLDMKHVSVDGATVVMEWEFTAKSAKGRDYNNVYCVVFVVADGLISEVREYCSTERAKRILFD